MYAKSNIFSVVLLGIMVLTGLVNYSLASSATQIPAKDLHGSCVFAVQKWHNPSYVDYCVPAVESLTVTLTQSSAVVSTAIPTETSPAVFTQHPTQEDEQVNPTPTPGVPTQESTPKSTQEPTKDPTKVHTEEIPPVTKTPKPELPPVEKTPKPELPPQEIKEPKPELPAATKTPKI